MSDAPDRLSAALADHYRIERELGAGGMATVYLAQDVRHDRKVALKILKPELAAVLGAERFVQEIKTTAALQHPHILPLFDSGSADGFLYYVMPYIEGETLRDRLNHEAQLGIAEAVKITTEVADALHYAHEHGVIHRDIKPENILLHGGRPVVADFGIALALSAAAGGRMTETGMSLGTPHYMSPEQATAEKEITARSDVYSLASVLYEMLAGAPPHVGGSAQQIIMRIVTDTARPVTELRKAVPPHVAAAVAKALEKLPADRFDSAKAFAEAVNNPAFTLATAAGAAPGARLVPRWQQRAVVPMAIGVAAVLGLALWGWLRPRPAAPVIHYALVMPQEQALSPGSPAPIAAPDGSYLVYWGPVAAGGPGDQLWLKRRDRYDATPLPGTVAATSAAISPDAQSIAFTVGQQLKTMQVQGGVPVTLVNDSVQGLGIAWLDDGTIAFVGRGGLLPALRRIPAGGGTATTLLQADRTGAALNPTALPDGRGILFGHCAAAFVCEEWVYDLRRDTARMVLPGGVTYAQYAATGHLLYQAEGALRAVPFDLDRLEVRGSAVPVADSVRGGRAGFSIARSGTLVLGRGRGLGSTPGQLVWVNRTGQHVPVDSTWTFALTNFASNHGWALSPDGSQVAIGLSTEAGDDIWVKRLPRGPAARITFDPNPDFRPRWTRDGRSIIFGSTRPEAGIYQRRADGTGSDSLLVASPTPQEAALSPDGQWLLLRVGGAAGPGGRDLTGIRLGQDTTLQPVLATRFDEEAIALSPDGRWLAYQSDETGRTEVFIRPFPTVDAGKWQVSTGGGVAPLWSRDGRELFYLSGAQNMMAVQVTPAGGALTLGNPQLLFRVPPELLVVETDFYTPWDVAADGRFLMFRALSTNAGQAGTVIVVENFLEELKTKVRQQR